MKGPKKAPGVEVLEGLKILMIAPTPFFSDRGCHIRIYEEIKGLTGRGYKILVLSYGLGRDLEGIEVRRVKGLSWYNKEEAGPSFHKLYLDFLLYFKAKRLAKEFKPDLLHCHLHEGCLIGSLVAKELNIPVVFDYQGSLSEELSEHNFLTRGSFFYKRISELEDWIVKRADFVVLSSESFVKELEGRISLSKQLVSGDGVDLERFKKVSLKKDEELFLELGLRRELPLVVYLGVLERYQGIDILLKAIQILKERKVSLQFLIMGYPLRGYPELAQRLGIADIVRFTGKIDYFKAHNYLCLGDIGVAPKISRTESNGKVLNYLGCGLAVVCFERANNRELLGDNAEYVKYIEGHDERNAENLADGIERLAIDSSYREELSLRGMEWVKRFSWVKVVDKLEQAYRAVLKG